MDTLSGKIESATLLFHISGLKNVSTELSLVEKSDFNFA